MIVEQHVDVFQAALLPCAGLPPYESGALLQYPCAIEVLLRHIQESANAVNAHIVLPPEQRYCRNAHGATLQLPLLEICPEYVDPSVPFPPFCRNRSVLGFVLSLTAPSSTPTFSFNLLLLVVVLVVP